MNRRQFVAGAVTLPIGLRATVDALAGGDPVALVTADTESRVAVVELSSGRVVRSIPTLPGPRSVESVSGTIGVVCHTAHGAVISLDPSGRTIWVSLGSKAEEVAVVDVSGPTAPRLVRRFRPPFLAHDVGIVPRGRHVWVSSGDRGALAVYDRRTGEVLRRLPADAPPQHVTFSSGNAYVTSGEDGTLRVQSFRDGRVLHLTRIPVGSYNVQEAFGWIVTPSLDRGSFCVLDRRGRLRHRVQVARSSHDACFVMTA
jgi:WD40 repeat protein